MSAFVRVSGPPNSNFLVGYPGISATLVRVSSTFSMVQFLARPLACLGLPCDAALFLAST